MSCGDSTSNLYFTSNVFRPLISLRREQNREKRRGWTEGGKKRILLRKELFSPVLSCLLSRGHFKHTQVLNHSHAVLPPKKDVREWKKKGKKEKKRTGLPLTSLLIIRVLHFILCLDQEKNLRFLLDSFTSLLIKRRERESLPSISFSSCSLLMSHTGYLCMNQMAFLLVKSKEKEEGVPLFLILPFLPFLVISILSPSSPE